MWVCRLSSSSGSEGVRLLSGFLCWTRGGRASPIEQESRAGSIKLSQDWWLRWIAVTGQIKLVNHYCLMVIVVNHATSIRVIWPSSSTYRKVWRLFTVRPATSYIQLPLVVPEILRNLDHPMNFAHYNNFAKWLIGNLGNTRSITSCHLTKYVNLADTTYNKVFSENMGHPEPIKIVIVKKCPDLLRIYCNHYSLMMGVMKYVRV